MPEDPLVRIGWIGVRGYGEVLWNAVSNLTTKIVDGCYHPDKDVAKEAGTRMHCTTYPTLDHAIHTDTTTAIVLTIPNEFHFQYAMMALEAGKHVFVEKPLANNYSDCRSLCKTAAQKDLILCVGHNYRHSSHIQKIRSLLLANYIGEVVAAELNMGHGGGLKFTPQMWRYHEEKCPGGPLNMLGSHLIDAANYLFGEVENVHGIVKNLYANTTAQDMSLVQLEYKNGVVANITNLYNSVSTEYIYVYGTKGAIRFTRWPQTGIWLQPIDVDRNSAPYKQIHYQENNSSRAIFSNFIDAVMGKDSLMVSPQDAAETVRIIETIIGFQK